MAPSLVRREPFGSQLGRRCEDRCQLHVNFDISVNFHALFKIFISVHTSYCKISAAIMMHSVDSNTIARLEEAIGTAMNAACEACSAEDAEPSFASLLALMGRHLLKDAGAQTNSEESDPISDLRRQLEDKDAEIARLNEACTNQQHELDDALRLGKLA
jgi:uncharacterized protein with von Willebrand factor type A (vWA) domain